ncbi:ADP-ribosylation factor-like protein 10 [Gracilinanus agilis]|nr:ADP-ribosylation factor-like protein 10 [Gracilinanus agilis]
MAPRSLSHVILLLGGAVAVLGSMLFFVWKAYFSDGSGRRRRPWWEAELSPYVGELDPDERQVLVLGLDGAGKSTILHCLSGHGAKERMAPTWGFNSVRLPTESFQMDLLEVGGSQNLRFYWKEFLSQADVLVFVVDSADRLRLPCARQELHMLLAEDPDLPVVVVANKQDKSEALSVAQLQQELDLQAFGQREFFLLPASIPPAGPGSSPPSIHHVWTLLLDLLSQA